ncbi:MAG: HAD family hydrolase [Desulfobacteraceae bacterium]|jgi:putative hydrolase of the HAD superfamily
MINKDLVAPYITKLTPLPTKLSPEGRLRPPVRCLLCDIYGSLFISGSGDISVAQARSGNHDALDELLAKYDVKTPASKVLRRFYKEIEDEHQHSRAKGVAYPEVQIEKIWSRVLCIDSREKVRTFAVEFEMLVNPTWPMPGLDGLIKDCRRDGVRLGIISNAQFFTPMLFGWFLDADPPALGFDPRLTFFSYQYGCAKPSALLFQLAADKLRELDIPSHQVAYLGNDMRNDIYPARQIGFQTILFAGDARSLRMRKDDPLCKHITPDLRITHLNQLTRHLN